MTAGVSGVGLLALLAGLSVLYTTPWGTGTGFDQGTYIGAARNLLAGRGLTIPWGIAAGQPLTHFPPLFPVLLALGGTLGPDPWVIARYLNAGLRSIDVALCAFLAWRLSPVPASALLAAFLLLCSVHMEFVFGSAWSEPLFLALALTSLYALASAQSSGSRLALVAAGVFAGAAVMTRYVGLTLLLTAALVLWRSKAGMRARLLNVATFGVLVGLPLVLWLVRNDVVAGNLVGNRSPGWHAPSVEHFTTGLFTLLDWIVPSTVAARFVTPEGLVTVAGVVVIVALAVGVSWFVWREHLAARLPRGSLAPVLLVFVGVYPVTVIVSILWFDDLTQLDSRILAPVYVSLVVLLSAYMGEVLTRLWRCQHSLRGLATALLAIGLTAHAVRFSTLVQRVHNEGVIYANIPWLTSPTMQAVSQLPTSARVFSNAPDAIYMLANRNAYDIPQAGIAQTFISDLYILQQSGPIVLVYFNDPNIAYRAPIQPDLLERSVPLKLVRDYGDGAMYELTL